MKIKKKYTIIKMPVKQIRCIDYYLTKLTYRYLYGNVINYDKTIEYLKNKEKKKKKE